MLQAQSESLNIYVSEDAKAYLHASLTLPCLRLGVSSGGCSGWTYSLEEVSKAEPDDTLTELGGDRWLVVNKDVGLRYLNGLSLTIVSSGYGQMLTFNNPNAEHTCGCKESFAIKES